MKYPIPQNEDAFEDFAIEFFRSIWSTRQADRFGRRGQRQHGVDILDLSGEKPLRAAQCKYHSLTDHLTAKELRAEVAKAKKFPMKIGHFYFLTTARRSTEAQLELVKINTAHRKKGLFVVELMTLESIERTIDERAELQAHVLMVPFPSVQREMQPLHAAISEIAERLGPVGEEPIERDLAEAKSLFDGHNYQFAQLVLNRLRNQHWNRMNPRQRFRCLLNLGNTHLRQGLYADAARLFLDASVADATDERAKGIEALAYELLDERTKAYALAEAALTQNPASTKAAAVRARTAPDQVTVGDLIATTPSAAVDAEVRTAFALAAHRRHAFEAAVEQARLARQTDPALPGAWFIEGNALLANEMAKFSAANIADRSVNKANLSASVDSLTKAIELASQRNAHAVQADALLLRSQAHGLLSAVREAKEDVESAYLLAPTRPDVLARRAVVLNDNGDTPGAIECLRTALRSEPNGGAKFGLASILERHNEAGRVEAAAIYRDLARDTGELYQDEAAVSAVRLLVAANQNQAVELINSVEECLAPATIDIMRAMVATADARQGDAVGLAVAAAAKLNSTSQTSTVRTVARGLVNVGRYALALPLFERLVVPGFYTPDVHSLIAIAARMQRYDIILRTCRTLREAGVDDEALFEQEVGLLERLDPDAAIALLQERLHITPEDATSRLRLSTIGVRLDRPEIVSTDNGAIPSPDAAQPAWLPIVVQILQYQNKHLEAAAFAYSALRRNFGAVDAHMALFIALQFRIAPLAIEVNPPHVTEMSAVKYLEDGESTGTWAVLESSNADIARNEIDIASRLGRKLEGKRVGDRVLITDGAVQDRSVTILEIIHKYIYRLQDVTDNWQIRFPDSPFVQRVRLDEKIDAAEPSLDFAPIFSLIDQRHEQGKQIMELYRANACPIHVVAKAVGSDDVSASIHIAYTDDAPLRAHWSSGTTLVKESQDRLVDLRAGLVPVLDATAVSTLILLGLEDNFGTHPTRAMLTYGVRDELRHWASRFDDPRMVSIIDKDNTQYVRREFNDQDRQEIAANRRQSAERIQSGVRVAGVIELAGVEPEIRSDIDRLFGTSGLESMVKASQPGNVLWTDDCTVGVTAQKHFGTRFVWTELVLRHWVETGRMDRESYLQACARLIGFGYAPVPYQPDVLLVAGELAQWRPHVFPLSQVIGVIGTSALNSRSLLLFLIQIFPQLYRRISLAPARTLVLDAILSTVCLRNDGQALLRALTKSLPEGFGLDVLGGRAAMAHVHAWLAAHGGQ